MEKEIIVQDDDDGIYRKITITDEPLSASTLLENLAKQFIMEVRGEQPVQTPVLNRETALALGKCYIPEVKTSVLVETEDDSISLTVSQASTVTYATSGY